VGKIEYRYVYVNIIIYLYVKQNPSSESSGETNELSARKPGPCENEPSGVRENYLLNSSPV